MAASLVMTSPESESVSRVGTFDPRSSTECGDGVSAVFCRLLKAKSSSYLLPMPLSATFISQDLSDAVERGSKEQSKSPSFSLSWQPPMRVCFKCTRTLSLGPVAVRKPGHSWVVQVDRVAWMR